MLPVVHIRAADAHRFHFKLNLCGRENDHIWKVSENYTMAFSTYHGALAS
jgi:hypothetical protein